MPLQGRTTSHLLHSVLLGGPIIPTAAAFSLDFTVAAQNTANQTTYTYSAQSLGAAPGAADRRYIIVSAGSPAAAGQTVSTMTVGGVSASLVTNGPVGNGRTEIWIAEVPTGTTGDVVVTWSAGVGGSSIGVYRMINPGSSTATDTDAVSHTLGVCILTLDIPASGKAVASVMIQETVLPTVTWTGTSTPSENFDAETDSGDAFSGALSTATGSNLTFIATSTDTTPTNMKACAASWGP